MEAETKKRATEFLEGLQHYKKTSFTRDVTEPPCVLECGAARLLYYGATVPDAPCVFLIPSLINRYYILDLTQKLSFARYLREQGMRVYIIDWGVPSHVEHHFNSAFYVTETLVPMLEWISGQAHEKVILGGYCMGGLLALALAQIRPDIVSGLALFATPWDFSTPHFPRFSLSESERTALGQYINSSDSLPAETIHTLFHAAHPYAFQKKLREFSRMDPVRPATQEFLAVEHWVNDGVPMTSGVARDCLIEWAQRNSPAQKQWRVGGQVIDPTTLRQPGFIAAPQGDKIVPSDCALPLVRLLRNHVLIEPLSGHIGMMVGGRRKAALWEPFTKWVYSLFT